MSTAKLTQSEVRAIIHEGAYYLLDDFAQREEICEKFRNAFLDGIQQIAGTGVRDRVAADGLGQVHRHFPVSKILLLESYLLRQLRNDLYFWSYGVGSETLGLSDPFYVDHLVMLRIHYPFLVARGEKTIEKPSTDWGERLRLAVAAVGDWRTLAHQINKKRRARKLRQERMAAFDPATYHRGASVAAQAHGPHVDTWYGHSYDGINLWLSVDGVNEDNTVILYPEMFGRPVDFDPTSMYLAPGISISRPCKIVPKPRQLLVFNPETLHGTQVNISDETRVALTTRINPGEPRFTPDAPFHMEHWYSSTGLRQRRFTAAKVFPSSKYQGEPSIKICERYVDPSTKRLTKDERLESESPSAVCSTDDLCSGEKLCIDFHNIKLLLWRHGEEIRAFNRACPHVGMDLADGSHDESHVYCPGHGIAFSLSNGRSNCADFSLRQYFAYEAEGKIFVELRSVSGSAKSDSCKNEVRAQD